MRKHRARPRTRRRVLVSALAASAVFLAGCAGLPIDNTVEPGLPVLGQAQQGVQVITDGPEDGMDPGQIVRGFLRANQGFTDDHDTARDYLTDEMAGQWQPTSQVLVYGGDIQVSTDGDRVMARVSVVGTVDEDGRLTETPSGTVLNEYFEMTRVGGQWRIQDLPTSFGLWLTRPDFERLYRALTVNYASSTSDEFVADVRWFPRYPQAAGLPTALARAQLEPTPEHLRGAVRNGIPTGLDLVAGGVPVDPATGVATVDLSGLGSGSSTEQQQLIWAQFARTLRQAPGVSGVRIQANGRTLPVDAPEEDSVGDPADIGFTDPRPAVDFALRRVRNELTIVDPANYRLAEYSPTGGEELPELPSVPIRWVNLATDPEVTDFAAVSIDRETVWRWRAGNEQEMRQIGTELTGPSFDGAGHFWIAGASGERPRVWVVDLSVSLNQAVARPVEAEWLTERWQVLDFEVAPGGQQALIHLRDRVSGREELGLTGIVRTGDGDPDDAGDPVSLTEPEPLAPTLQTVTSVGWLNPLTLVALGQRREDTVVTPFLVPVGGFLEPFAPIPGDTPTAIRGVPGDEEVVLVLTEQGRIYLPEASTWETYRPGDDLVIPGH
ncbi:LpqB family beta-propeller domain-containing protein [Ornithinicoccus hortensis]|uniref:Sporulation and spore germination protein n=1 Tax=Ornithinicoccus hortensis TaxID=82346 RepID=A0A542YQF4_9MICO|nr:LpqB family beta-propeller domain-containing protein [Ornithinicoccus hortensis]TQL50330.1 sporulation and spore germination protein [Ornithinicoccus hortensis]